MFRRPHYVMTIPPYHHVTPPSERSVANLSIYRRSHPLQLDPIMPPDPIVPCTPSFVSGAFVLQVAHDTLIPPYNTTDLGKYGKPEQPPAPSSTPTRPHPSRPHTPFLALYISHSFIRRIRLRKHLFFHRVRYVTATHNNTTPREECGK